MSRRRKLPPQPPGTVRVFTVNVVCTDRGQHASVLLDRLVDGRDVNRGPVLLWHAEKDAPITPWRTSDGSHTFQFTCCRCQQHYERREPNLLAMVDVSRSAHPQRRG